MNVYVLPLFHTFEIPETIVTLTKSNFSKNHSLFNKTDLNGAVRSVRISLKTISVCPYKIQLVHTGIHNLVQTNVLLEILFIRFCKRRSIGVKSGASDRFKKNPTQVPTGRL